MRTTSRTRRAGLGVLGGAILASGCGSSNGTGDFSGLDRAERNVGRDRPRTIEAGVAPLATIDGEPVTETTLVARLAEAQGGLVLEELVLERALENELARRGLSLSPAAVAAEQSLLEQSLRSELGDSDRQRLLLTLRRSRGLGPERFQALLRRNAMLRVLVADRVDVTAEQVELAWRIRHGERVRIRLIALLSQQRALEVRRELSGLSGADREARFIQIAVRESIDPTAPAGGLVEAFSPDDPAYEDAVRQSSRSLSPGELSQVVAIRSGFAVIMLDSKLAPSGVSLEGSTPEIRRDLQTRQERLLMDELAKQLIAESRVTVFDPSLGWSWNAAERGTPRR